MNEQPQSTEVRGDVCWVSKAGAMCQAHFSGASDDVGALVAAKIPEDRGVTPKVITLLALDGDLSLDDIGLYRQVIGLETPKGPVTVRLGVPDPDGPHRPARAQRVVVHRNWRRIGDESVAPRRLGLVPRIAKAVGDDAAYVGACFDRVVKANPGADLHKVLLRPRSGASGRLDTWRLTIDRRRDAAA